MVCLGKPCFFLYSLMFLSLLPYFLFLVIRRPPRSTLFPYTTLFRSGHRDRQSASCMRFAVSKVWPPNETDRKSTRLNSSHEWSSYAVFCLKEKIAGQIVLTSEIVDSITKERGFAAALS